jgi:hypothetical protein
MAITKTKDGKVQKGLSKRMAEKRQKSFEALKKKALLVSLERSTFANFVFDMPFNEKVCKHYDVQDTTVLQVRKCLIHPRYLEKLMNITNDSVMLLYNLTRPWDNNDFRLLPMEMYDDFQQTFQKLKDDFEEHFDTFKSNYTSYIKEAKLTLGEAFNKDDYPKATELDSIFTLNVVTREIPDIDDIRLNLTEEELISLEEEAGSDFAEDTKNIKNTFLSVMDGVSKAIGTGTLSKEVVEELARIGSLVEIINKDSDPAINDRVLEFKEAILGQYNDLDVDDLMLTEDEREEKAYAEMSEEDMMMSAEDDDEEEDDLDNW